MNVQVISWTPLRVETDVRVSPGLELQERPRVLDDDDLAAPQAPERPETRMRLARIDRAVLELAVVRVVRGREFRKASQSTTSIATAHATTGAPQVLAD